MALTISAPTTYGTIQLTGQKRGPFLIHRDFVSSSVWTVTHIDTGLKFPFLFDTKRNADSFARDVVHLLDWSSIKAKMVPGKRKAKFVKGAPTRKQLKAIYELADAREGMRTS